MQASRRIPACASGLGTSRDAYATGMPARFTFYAGIAVTAFKLQYRTHTHIAVSLSPLWRYKRVGFILGFFFCTALILANQQRWITQEVEGRHNVFLVIIV